MEQQLTDRSGAPVEVRVEEAGGVGSYIISVADGETAGRADFVDSGSGAELERIIFHTEVDEQFGGRGLAGILVREALQDSIRSGFGIVPVCPLFASHLKKHGDEFIADGGVFRRPKRDDLVLVSNAVRGA